MTTASSNNPVTGGGAATARGINFQAAVTAICNTHLARGIPLGWLAGIGQDIPVSVAAETSGPGDDIKITNQKGETIEAQVKAGLTAGDRLWDSLLDLARGISNAEIDYGVLVVSPDSSGTIKNDLKTDIRHMGDGRSDALHSLGEMFRNQLVTDGIDVPSVCARLRIVTLHCQNGDDASTRAALAEIAHLLADQKRVQDAWDILCQDAATLIEYRGQRNTTSIIQLLRSRNIQLRLADASPAAIVNHLSDWTAEANKAFSVFGVPRPLPIDTGWIPVSIVVRGSEEKTPVGLAEALEFYHNWQKRGFGHNTRGSAPETFGRFYRRCVVVAGPGMGKSTLLKKLARLYARDAYPIISVKLSLIATRIKETGASFEEALFAHGLDGAGLSRTAIDGAGIDNWIVLCDGLDECGNLQELIADGLLKLAAGKPRLTIIVTTRPVGYNTGLLQDWRHYELLPLDADKPGRHIDRLLEAIYPNDVKKRGEVSRFALDELTKSEATKTVLRSPLLLGLATSLASQGKAFGESKEQLYDRLFDIIDSIPNSRDATAKPGRPVLLRFLEVLAWDTVEHPADPIAKTLDRCSRILAGELKCGDLEAATIANECSNYWQSVGLLESVSHAGDQTLTFVHKTFGEYAAGRYIARACASDRARIVPVLFASESADEVLDFAGALGAAEELCAVLLTADANGPRRTTNIARCVRLVGEANVAPPAAQRTLIYSEALSLLTSRELGTAYAIADVLPLAARRFPVELSPLVEPLLNHAQVWTRLGAWSAILACGPSYYVLDGLLEAFRTLPKLTGRRPREFFRRYRSDLSFRGTAVEAFILAALKELLTRCDANKIDPVVKEVFKADNLQTVGLIQEVLRVLQAHGRSYSPFDSQSALKGYENFHFDGELYKSVNDNAFATIFGALRNPGNPETGLRKGQTVLLWLSAFVQLTGIWEMASSDIWGWQNDKYPNEAKLVIGYARDLTGLDGDELALDAEEAVRHLRERPDDGKLGVFELLSGADAPPIDWARAASMTLDLAAVERATYHGSDWLVQLAANILLGSCGPAKLSEIVKRLLTGGQETTLWAAAALAESLPPDHAQRLIFERFKDPLKPGCRYLFDALRKAKTDFSADMVTTLKAALHAKEVETAVAAAKYCAEATPPPPASLRPLLEDAYAYWQQHEEPYPAGSGTIPPSPRDDLVRAIRRIGPLSNDQLFQMATDRRVRDVVERDVLARVSSDSRFSIEFIKRVGDGTLPAKLLENGLRDLIALEPDQVGEIEKMLLERNPELRYAALGILDEAYLDRSKILPWLDKLDTDANDDVRQHVLWIANNKFPGARQTVTSS